MRDTFSGYHPIINFMYFVMIFGFSMVFTNPVCLAISFICASAYIVCQGGISALGRQLLYMLPVFVFTALLNPAFSHAGITILAYLPGGNPLTLESIIYGIGTGIMLAEILCWFSCFNRIMTSDKFIYLFGRIIPGLSLIISMTLRFIPRLKEQLKSIIQAQKCLGRDISKGNIFARIRNGLAVLSVLITISMDNAIDTSDSMRSRAYGLKGRSAFSIYRFDSRDRLAVIWLAVCGIYVLAGAVSGGVYWQYYPYIKGRLSGPYTTSIFMVYFMLCITPAVINIYEERRWKIIQSKI